MKKIYRYTTEDVNNLLSKTTYVLPDNPSDKSFSAVQIKRKMYEGLLVLKDWLLEIIDTENENIENINNYFIEKLTTTDGIVVIPNSSADISKYEENQMFFVKDEMALKYRNAQGTLTLYEDVAFVVPQSMTVGALLPIDKINCKMCYLLYSDVVYRKDRVDGNNIQFVTDYQILSGEDDESDLFGRVECVVNKNTGAIISYEIATKYVYSKDQIDTQFYNKTQVDGFNAHFPKKQAGDSEETISNQWYFAVLPQTQAGRTYGSERDIVDKELLDSFVGLTGTTTVRIANEETRAKNAENALDGRVSVIEGYVPTTTKENPTDPDYQLVNRAIMNSTVATETASFRGTYDIVTDLELVHGASDSSVATALATKISTVDSQDYCYVVDVDLAGNTLFRRFKYSNNVWLYEYVLNNSSFTAEEWEAIKSGATTALINQIMKNKNNICSDEYDSTETYDTGDIVMHGGVLKIAIADNVTGTWDDTKWNTITIKEIIDNHKEEVAILTKKVPQYVDLTISTSDTWTLNAETNRYELSKSTGVLDLTNNDTVLALPNGKESDTYIRAFDIVEESFNNATGVVTFSCAVEPTETINITLQILRR